MQEKKRINKLFNQKKESPKRAPKYQSKYTKKYLNQYNRVKAAYSEVPYPLTMLQISEMTGIYRANICRYNAEMQKNGNLILVRKGICPISLHRAGFYTVISEEVCNE